MSSAELRFNCSTREACSGLFSVMAPDNEGTPAGMTLKSNRKGSTAAYAVTSEKPSRVIATALALLRDAALFEEVWLLSRRPGAEVRRKDRR